MPAKRHRVVSSGQVTVVKLDQLHAALEERVAQLEVRVDAMYEAIQTVVQILQKGGGGRQ